MVKKIELLKRYSHVSRVSEVVGEWELCIGQQQLKIKINSDHKGNFEHKTSHFYHGTDQSSPYVLDNNGGRTIEEALHSAMNQLLSLYDPSDEQAVWKNNSSY